MFRLFTISIFILMAVSFPCHAAKTTAQVMTGEKGTMEVVFFQEEAEVARWRYDKDGALIEKTGAVPDGRVETYSNGILMSKARFKDGELHGASRDYYTNGNLRTVARYKDGELHGSLSVYYDGGGRHFITKYRNGEPYGVMKVYYQNGRLKTRGHFENGKLVLVERYNQKGKMVKKKIIPEGRELSPLETP